VAGIAAAVLLLLTDMIIHGKILEPYYDRHYTFMRASMPLWPAVARLLATGLLFAWIYTYGLRPGAPGWAQGMRFGFWIGLFYWTGYALLDYTILPIPAFYVVAWIFAGTIQMVLAGFLVGAIYPAPPAEETEPE
jgi:hypothetical protein